MIPPQAPNIALYGASGSGKSTVAQYLVGRYAYQHVRTGKACRELCSMLFSSETKTIMNEVTIALSNIDKHVWLRAALRDVSGAEPIVFDSMRSQTDYDYFRVRDYVLVILSAPLPMRVDRLRERGQIFDPRIDAGHPVELALDALTFDWSIDNLADQAGLFGQVDQLLSLNWQGTHASRRERLSGP
jgi:cytidylate kinase